MRRMHVLIFTAIAAIALALPASAADTPKNTTSAAADQPKVVVIDGTDLAAMLRRNPDIPPVRSPRSGTMANLEGGFRSVFVANVSSGVPVLSCVETVAAAQKALAEHKPQPVPQKAQ